MKAICPYCEKEFEKRRRNQLYCHTYCRQGDYILRKTGRKDAVPYSKRSLSVGNLEVPSVVNPSNKNVAVKSSPQLSDQKNAGRWNIKAMSGKQHMNVLSTDKLRKETITKNKQRFTKKRRRSMRRFEADVAFRKEPAQNTNATKSVDVLTTDIPPQPKPAFPPVESIPAQAPGEQVLDYMVRYGLTLPLTPEQLKADIFPHWSPKDKKAFAILNEKMCEALEMLRSAGYRKSKPTNLQIINSMLHELTDGIYTLFMPEDYPFLRFIQLVKHKLGKVLESTRDVPDFEFQLPEAFAQQMMLVCWQTGHAK